MACAYKGASISHPSSAPCRVLIKHRSGFLDATRLFGLALKLLYYLQTRAVLVFDLSTELSASSAPCETSRSQASPMHRQLAIRTPLEHPSSLHSSISNPQLAIRSNFLLGPNPVFRALQDPSLRHHEAPRRAHARGRGRRPARPGRRRPRRPAVLPAQLGARGQGPRSSAVLSAQLGAGGVRYRRRPGQTDESRYASQISCSLG